MRNQNDTLLICIADFLCIFPPLKALDFFKIKTSKKSREIVGAQKFIRDFKTILPLFL